MNEIELKVSVDEANLIMEGLGQMQFTRVYSLISKVQEQAAQQLKGEESQAAEVTQLGSKSAVEA